MERGELELWELMRDNLRHAGVQELCPAGVVMTGGGACLEGLAELCERVIKRPVRVASPMPIAKLPAQLAEPQFATMIGMAMYSHRSTAARMMSPDQGVGSRPRALRMGLGAEGPGIG